MTAARIMLVAAPHPAVRASAAALIAAGARLVVHDGISGAAAALAAGADAARAAGADPALADGGGCDLVLCDLALPYAALVLALRRRAAPPPLVVCSVAAPAVAAAQAIRMGAADYLSLPLDSAGAATALAIARGDTHGIAVERLVGLSMASVERALIETTLRRLRGNRTQASALLGISVRTMRNKLRDFAHQSAGTGRPGGVLRP